MQPPKWLALICVGWLALADGAETDGGRSLVADRSALRLELLFEGDLADTSGARRTCTAHNGLAFSEGPSGRCAAFDGRAWIDTGVLQEQLGNEFTLECWVNPAAQQSVYADVFGNHVAEGLGVVLQQDGSAVNDFMAACGAGAGRWVVTDAVPLTADSWQHVALVKTSSELRIYVNGVLVADQEDAAPTPPSPLPMRVGLGYTAPERCFRGLVDDFRIWTTALTDFRHAGIAPTAVQETGSLYLNAEPRPVADAPVQSWTVASDDTRLTIGTTARGELVLMELTCPAAARNFITRPVAFGFLPHAVMEGQRRPLEWRFREGTLDANGKLLTLRFASDNPSLELFSQWQAHDGPGPVRHRLSIRNGSNRTVTIPDQPSFDLDLTGASELWCFHSDGVTPDPVGVYRHSLTPPGAKDRCTVRTAPTGQFIPYVVFDAEQRQGVYLGLEWSFCRIETVVLENLVPPAVRVRAGNSAERRTELGPGDTFEARPGFVGTYTGDVDDAGNRLRRWLLKHCLPRVLRDDATYPKVQWNAFGATGKTPGSWDPVEAKFYPLVDDIAPLGFEEVMIDVGWWQGNEPASDQQDWPGGMKKAADYAHEKGLRFGLYWTDDLDMANAEQRERRADRIGRLFREYGADMWRSDCTRGEVIGPSYAATRGFYELVDRLSEEIPGFQWENCSGGGRIKDFGAMRRCVKIFNSDTYSALHVRQAFFDSSHVFHPIQLEGHLGSVDGRYRPRGVSGIKYAFRSSSLGAPEWFLDAPNGGNGTDPWTAEEREALKACIATYKTRVRPLVRQADLFHVLPRPDGKNWDGIEYYDPVAEKGLLAVFKPAGASPTVTVRLRGLDPDTLYAMSFEDSSEWGLLKRGAELLRDGLELTLEGEEVSEWVFLESVIIDFNYNIDCDPRFQPKP